MRVTRELDSQTTACSQMFVSTIRQVPTSKQVLYYQALSLTISTVDGIDCSALAKQQFYHEKLLLPLQLLLPYTVQCLEPLVIWQISVQVINTSTWLRHI
jgi:hypothetical protein